MKKTQQNLLQVPGTGVPQAATLTTTDYEDQEVEQQTLICTVPTTTSTACESLQHMTVSYIIQPQPLVIQWKLLIGITSIWVKLILLAG